MHQDAFSTTNGGEGIPYWVAADFQAPDWIFVRGMLG